MLISTGAFGGETSEGVASSAPAQEGASNGRGQRKDTGARPGGSAPAHGATRPLHGATRRGAVPLLCAGLALLGASARAQSPDVLFSLSADDTLPAESVRDQDLVLHVTGLLPHVSWPSETLSALAGDGGQALHPVFTDVDAVHDRGPGATAADGLLFSITVDEAGFKDGDVVGVGAGGNLEVVMAEPSFIAAVGSTDGNVDLDAFQQDPDGTVLFSFGDNEASSFLSGDDPNVIEDGDVLMLAPGATVASVLFTESQIDAFVGQALGATSSTVDTLALARNPQDGAVLFTVQSPTAHDASVFSTAAGGSLLAGHAEADLGFTGAPELDALSVSACRFPAATTSASKPAPGSSVTLTVRDAQPGALHLALVALARVPPAFTLSGWGGFVLQQDALLGAALSAAPSLVIVPDGTGHGALTAALPLAIGPTDVIVQIVAPAPAPAGSNPLLLELAQ
jgi:hypothetical protein